MRHLLAIAIAALLSLPALAQSNMALIAPTAPAADSSDRIANTAWVNGFLNTKGFFADPRDYGATCGSNFNVNSSANDDAPGINAALATGLPVVIPYPGCKAATQIQFSGYGQTIFSFGRVNTYDQQLAATTPYIFVPDALYTGASNHCAVDSNGFDVTLRNVAIRGTSGSTGIAAVCNSQAAAQGGLPAAFLNIDGLTISDVGTGIGGALVTGASCAGTGTLGNNLQQIKGHDLSISHTCYGLFGNFSDVHLSDVYFSSLTGNCIATTSSSAWELTNIRCEFTGYNPGNFVNGGTGFYIAGGAIYQFNNVRCDQIQGPCFTIGNGTGNAGNVVTLTNVMSSNAGGDPTQPGGGCQYLIDGAIQISAHNIGAVGAPGATNYTLCIKGTTTDYLTWHAVAGGAPEGTAQQGGYTISYVNQIGTPPPHFDLQLPGNKRMVTDSVPFGATAFSVGATAGVTCAGALTGSAVVTNGIVTHC